MSPVLDPDYPSRAEIKRIREWDAMDARGLLAFVESIFPDYGRFSDKGWRKDKVTGERHRLIEMATGGWSGCEEIMDALGRNRLFHLFYWAESHRGGLSRFHIPEELWKAQHGRKP